MAPPWPRSTIQIGDCLFLILAFISNFKLPQEEKNRRRNCYQNRSVLQEIAAGPVQEGENSKVSCRTGGFWISKYYSQTAFKVDGINLECFVSQGLVLDCKGLVLNCNPTACALDEQLIQLQDIIETGVDAESLDIDDGTVIWKPYFRYMPGICLVYTTYM